MRYISIILFLFILISGCKDTPLTSIKKIDVDTAATFPLNAPTYGWEKVDAISSLSYFAFDSKRNVYFINANKLFVANENFVIKDTLVHGSASLFLDKIFINENDILFLAKYSGFNHQLYVSNDIGKTWSSPNGFQNTQISNFYSKGSRVYITSGAGDESEAMVQLSVDNGNDWRTIINNGTSGYFDFPRENGMNELFFVGNSAFYYSVDYGNTITEKKYNLNSAWDNSLAFGFNNDLLLGTDSGIYLTKNNGVKWQCIYNNTDPMIYFFTVFNSSNGNIYAMHRWENNSMDYGLKGVYVSKDGGHTWYSFLTQPKGNYDGTYLLGKDDYLYIVVNVNNVNKLYRSSVKL
jgi:photosystem II stability/assembly factor-like uncharacterized protein